MTNGPFSNLLTFPVTYDFAGIFFSKYSSLLERELFICLPLILLAEKFQETKIECFLLLTTLKTRYSLL